MPTPEREVQPQSPQVQPSAPTVSMKDLLASCAAATAVSTPPGAGRDADEREYEDDAEDDADSAREGGNRVRPAARRDAA